MLSPLQERILEILGFSSELYTRLCPVSSEPPSLNLSLFVAAQNRAK
jgi:hypothetical protein